MRKILIIMTTLGMGGAEKSLISLLNTIEGEYLKNNDIQIDLLVADTNSRLLRQVPGYVNLIKCPPIFRTFALKKTDALTYSGTKIEVLLLKIMWSVATKLFGKGLTENEAYWSTNKWSIPALYGEYDVCFAYMNGTATYYAIDKVRAKKTVVWVHNDYEKLKYTDSFQKIYFEQADKIITISNRCVESINKHFSQFSEKVQMIENISPYGLIQKQADEFTPVEYQNESRPKIISIGRLNYQKGFDIGLEAMKLLKSKGIQFIWYIIGIGEERAGLKRLIQEYQLEENVILLGLRENPYPYLKEADIFFQPSRFEGKAITLDEAMILARPIVVSNYDTVIDSIEDGVNGLICELNAEGLSSGLEKVISNPELQKAFKKKLSETERGNIEEIIKYYYLMLL